MNNSVFLVGDYKLGKKWTYYSFKKCRVICHAFQPCHNYKSWPMRAINSFKQCNDHPWHCSSSYLTFACHSLSELTRNSIHLTFLLCLCCSTFSIKDIKSWHQTKRRGQNSFQVLRLNHCSPSFHTEKNNNICPLKKTGCFQSFLGFSATKGRDVYSFQAVK